MATCPFCGDEVVPLRHVPGRALCPTCGNSGIRQAQSVAPTPAQPAPRPAGANAPRLLPGERILHEVSRRRGAPIVLVRTVGILLALLGFAGLQAALQLGYRSALVSSGIVLLFWGGAAACFALAGYVRHQTYYLTDQRLIRKGRFHEESLQLSDITAISEVSMLGRAILVEADGPLPSMLVTSVGDPKRFLDAMRQSAAVLESAMADIPRRSLAHLAGGTRRNPPRPAPKAKANGKLAPALQVGKR